MVGLAIAAVFAFAAALLIHQQKTSARPWSLVVPPEYVGVASRMAELEQKQQFDDEIQLGLHSLRSQPSDYFIYHMVAQAYATREYKDPQQSAKWAELAAEYSDKTMDANPNDLSNVFNVGQTYALAGDNLPTSESCRYYEKAANIFEKLTPRLQGYRATIQGESFRLAPFRQYNAERLADVKRELASCNDRVPTNEPRVNPLTAKAATQMMEFARKGDYDKAVRTGLGALKESPDGFIYQQIAMVYLMRAYKEPGLRDPWAREAVFYAEKSLEFARKSLEGNAHRLELLNLHEAGRILETAGDLSSAKRCEYYAEAIKVFTDEAPLLQGEYIEAYGYRRPLAPLRNENDKSLIRAKGKLVGAGCAENAH
jgi:tetratricopeptide (TPR) repeat protein